MPTNITENIYSSEYENDANPIPSNRIGYDNTSSGLSATNVQGAIDELASEKQDTAYDNTTSGLTATTVVGAIDELAGQQTTSKTPTFTVNPDRYQCSKTGKLCMINAYWATPTTGNVVITFPEDMKPDTTAYVEALAWDSNSTIIRCAITSAGALSFPVDSSKNYSLMAIWDSI